MFSNAASPNTKRNLAIIAKSSLGVAPFKMSTGNIAQHQMPILEIGKETKEGSAQKGTLISVTR
jgi:hypothetical protein